jgi:hypothetical protein
MTRFAQLPRRRWVESDPAATGIGKSGHGAESTEPREERIAP